MIRAEADSEGPETGTGFLFEGLDLLGDVLALNDAKILRKTKRDAAGGRFKRICRAQIEQRLELHADPTRQPKVDPGLNAVSRRAVQRFVGE